MTSLIFQSAVIGSVEAVVVERAITATPGLCVRLV
jgi:hypothetical protein